MWVKRIASHLLRGFANERRRVISDWRVLIHARRLAYAENAPLPDQKKASEIIKELSRRGDLSTVKGVERVYIVEVPYANLLDVSEEQIIQEADPWGVFSFRTAMVYHGLTDLMPNPVFATHFKDGQEPRRLPLGTTREDWVDLEFPSTRQPHRVREVDVNWTKSRGKWEFGITVGFSMGLPIYVTDVERTLLDALRMPEKCGGIAKVFEAWLGAEHMNISRLVDYTDQFDIQNLRQRVGYLLERLGRGHPRLEEWRNGLQRGGSVKLIAGEAYSGIYSPDWNLSLNVPSSVLAILSEEYQP